MGQYELSIRVVKSAGLSFTRSAPLGRVAAPESLPSEPQPAAPARPTAISTIARVLMEAIVPGADEIRIRPLGRRGALCQPLGEAVQAQRPRRFSAAGVVGGAVRRPL